ncbi:MAG: exopolysaccharide biosynthesis protein, partial [Planctomycetota bacterium]
GRRLPSIFMTTCGVSVAVVALLLVWPNQYRSEGMMYVRLGRGALAVDPTTKANTAVSMQESRTAEVVSIGEMIGSREIAERAVDRVGVDHINAPRTWITRSLDNLGQTLSSDDGIGGWLPKSEKTVGAMTADEVDAQLDRERAIMAVMKAVNVSIAKNGYTIAVSGKEDDPLLIQQIVQAVMDEFGSYHVQAHQNEGSETFFEEQAEASRLLAMQAREKLQSTRNDLGWLSADSAERTLSERIIDLEAALNQADSELAEATSQASELRRQLMSTDKWVPTATTLGIANAAGDTMRSQLYEVQIQDGEELSKLSPNHPRYRRLQEKMSQSERLAVAERKDRSERVESINPVYQELETQFQTIRAKAVGLDSRRSAVMARLEATKDDLRRLNTDRTTLAKLTWEAELAEDTFREHARSLEEARVNAELDAQNMSDVSVIQPASLNLKKAGPMRAMLSILGAMLGLSLGLLQAILRDPPVAPSRSGPRGIEPRMGDSVHASSSAPMRPTRDRASFHPVTAGHALTTGPLATGQSAIPVDGPNVADAATGSSSTNGQTSAPGSTATNGSLPR